MKPSSKALPIVFILISALIISACEYVPQQEFSIETTSGEVVTFMCPEVDPNRSKITYTIDQECRIIKKSLAEQ